VTTTARNNTLVGTGQCYWESTGETARRGGKFLAGSQSVPSPVRLSFALA
jgi:hypothetical protein